MTPRAPFIVAGVYVLVAVVANALVWDVSLFDGDTYLSIFDAKGYHALGQQIWGADPIDGARLAQRGYLFSLVAVALLSIHPIVLFVAQLSAVAFGLWALACAERRIAGRIRLTPIAVLMPSLWLAPSHLMTESFGFALASLGVILVVSRAGAWAAVALWVGTLMKPALLLGALAALLIPVRSRMILPLLAVAALIIPQLVLTARHSDRMALSTAGTSNFVERFHPAVMGFAVTGEIIRYRDPAAIPIRKAAPKLSYKIADVVSHPVAAFGTWQYILRRDHLWQSSGYLARNIDGLNWKYAEPFKHWSLWLNIGLSFLLPFSLTGIVLYLRSVPVFRWPAAVTGAGILVLAPLVYWQGDRVVFVGVVLLLPFASLAIARIARRLPI